MHPWGGIRDGRVGKGAPLSPNHSTGLKISGVRRFRPFRCERGWGLDPLSNPRAVNIDENGLACSEDPELQEEMHTSGFIATHITSGTLMPFEKKNCVFFQNYDVILNWKILMCTRRVFHVSPTKHLHVTVTRLWLGTDEEQDPSINLCIPPSFIHPSIFYTPLTTAPIQSKNAKFKNSYDCCCVGVVSAIKSQFLSLSSALSTLTDFPASVHWRRKIRHLKTFCQSSEQIRFVRTFVRTSPSSLVNLA